LLLKKYATFLRNSQGVASWGFTFETMSRVQSGTKSGWHQRSVFSLARGIL
jgi:hypothetical protein